MWYLYKFLYRLNFDNCYIDQFIVEVDGKRMALHEDKESIFPLTWKEELTYIKPSKWQVSSYFLTTLLSVNFPENLLKQINKIKY